MATTNITNLQREIPASIIFGMGITSETLQLDDDRLRYEGIEHNGLIWRFLRVDRTVHLSDITSFGQGYSIHPIAYILLGICSLNLIANIFEWNSYFQLWFWELPYLWIFSTIAKIFITSSGQWTIAHLLMILFYIGIIWLSRRHIIQFEIGHQSSIAFQTNGIDEDEIESFVNKFRMNWNTKKSNAA